jgi:superfamily II DNA or RNA helicase
MIKNKYDQLIYERYNDLMILGKTKDNFTNYDLSKIFELYTCIKLEEIYHQAFYMYDDIDATFKEINRMSKNDTGIDCSNMINTIVQCKLRAKRLGLDECGTFFGSQNIFDKISKKVVVRWDNLIITHNSDCSLSKNLKEKLDFELFTDYSFDKQEMIAYCEKLIGNPPEIKKGVEVELRDYQIECINLIKDNNKNIIICLPTGTGKNIVIIYSFTNNKNYLILVPRVILTEQLNEEIIGLKPEYKNKIQIIGDGNEVYDSKKEITICVYNSVSTVEPYFDTFEKIYIDEAHHIYKPEIYIQDDEEFEVNDDDTKYEVDDKKNDKIVVNFNEIINNYQDDKNIDDGILSDSPVNDETDEYQLNDLSDNTSSENIKDDIEDEMHKKDYMKIIKNLTKYNNNIYLSATIDKTDGFLYYGKDIREMIEKGYLCDYTIHVPIFTDSPIVDVRSVVSSDKAKLSYLPNNKKICEYLIKNYRTMIVYCDSQKEGKAIKDQFNEIRNGSAEYIDCNTTKKTRNEIDRRYKDGKIPFLVNVRILCEGYNAPITQGVVFMHLPSSKTRLIQIIGRALRLYQGKTYAKIILPFSCKEDEGNINNFLKVMAMNDSRIKKSFENKTLGGYIEIDKVNKKIEECDENNELEFRYEQIYDKLGVLQNRREIWEQKLEIVKKYINEFSKKPSYYNPNKEIKSLGSWIYTQRKNYKIKFNVMSNQEIYDKWTNFIDDNKYKKYFISNDEDWNIKLERVKRYIDINNKRPSGYNKNKEIKILVSWINVQKKNHKTKSYIMANEKIYDQWTSFINDNKYKKYFLLDEEEWDTNLVKIKIYIDENHKRPSSNDKNKEIKKLGKWISYQYNNYKTKAYTMSNQEIFNKWSNFINENKYKKYFISNEEEWYTNLEKIKQYMNNNNRRPSSTDKNKNIKKLGSWIIDQQLHYKTKLYIMSNQKIFDEWTNFINDNRYKKYFMSSENIWYTNLERVKQYIDKNQKRPNKDNNKEIKKLSWWVSTQQKNYKTKSNFMKNAKIWCKYTDFILDAKYNKYFPDMVSSNFKSIYKKLDFDVDELIENIKIYVHNSYEFINVCYNS